MFGQVTALDPNHKPEAESRISPGRASTAQADRKPTSGCGCLKVHIFECLVTREWNCLKGLEGLGGAVLLEEVCDWR